MPARTATNISPGRAASVGSRCGNALVETEDSVPLANIQVAYGFLLLTEVDGDIATYIKGSEITAVRPYNGGSMVWFHSPSIHCFIFKETSNSIMDAIRRLENL